MVAGMFQRGEAGSWKAFWNLGSRTCSFTPATFCWIKQVTQPTQWMEAGFIFGGMRDQFTFWAWYQDRRNVRPRLHREHQCDTSRHCTAPEPGTNSTTESCLLLQVWPNKVYDSWIPCECHFSRGQTLMCPTQVLLQMVTNHMKMAFPSIVIVQLLNHASVFATPWTAAHQASLSFTISWSLLKLMSIEFVIPSNHLILCHPLLLPSIFPNIRVFSNELALCIRWPKYRSFSFSISPFKEYSGLISFRIDWFDFHAV